MSDVHAREYINGMRNHFCNLQYLKEKINKEKSKRCTKELSVLREQTGM